jgi:hypothetical protein
MDGKILITGTGRSGTTAFFQLLSALGMDTAIESLYYNQGVNAGYEYTHDLTASYAPQVIKDPRLTTQIPSLLKAGLDISIVFVMVRDLDSAVQSRLKNGIVWADHSLPELGGDIEISDKGTSQLVFNQRILSTLFVDLTLNSVPFLPLAFPRFINDRDYLYAKLCAVPLVNKEGRHPCRGRFAMFNLICDKVFDPQLVHHKQEKD